MPRIFAIGDIHGCSKTFKKLMDKISIQKKDKIYCIGDYIDRGNDSKGVVDFILKLRSKGYQIRTLRGNHEEMMMISDQDEIKFKHWFKNGGEATLKSFGISSYKDLKPVYKNFFNRTKFIIQTSKFIFVHAGLNTQMPNPFEDKYAMLWIRDFTIDKHKLGNKILIHGHTPQPLDFILNQQVNNVINIDAGCVFKHREDMSCLIALNLNERKFIYTKNID